MTVINAVKDKMNNQYSILIQWSEEDRCFVASFPEFGPYAKTQGENHEEALKNANEVLYLLLEQESVLPQPNIYKSSADA